MTDQELADLLSRGYELRGVEFKGARPRTDKLLFAKVARAVLGMANRRDGGLVIIGIDDVGGVLQPTGLSAAELATWQYDPVAAGLGEYADPSVRFDLRVVSYDGKQFVVLQVREFDSVPILCDKEYNDKHQTVLRRGACYVRSQKKPETSEIPTQEDMRELINLAVDKGIRSFIEKAYGAEMFGSTPTPSPTDVELFNSQLGELR